MNGGFTVTLEEGKGYAPPEPSGSPWPCPLVSPEPVYATDGTLTCTVVPTSLPPTGGPDVASIFIGSVLLIAAAAVVWTVSSVKKGRR